jgi:hypothetical protein
MASQGWAFTDLRGQTKLYHEHSSLECSDCHEGNLGNPDGISDKSTIKSMLKKPTTDLCLSCHEEAGADMAKAPYVATMDGKDPGVKGRAMPAGDFYFSRMDPKKGHNPGKSSGRQASAMPSDPRLTRAPGGTFGTADWDCCSCHEPHYRFSQKATAWRQLKRKVNGIVHTGNETAVLGVESSGGNSGGTTAGYKPIESNSRGDLVNGEYIQERKDHLPLDGANLFIPEGETNKNVYQGGFSSFCATCHGDFHGGDEGASGLGGARSSTGNTAIAGQWVKHPSNLALGSSSRYDENTYNKNVINQQGTNPNPAGYDWKYPLVKVDGKWSVTSPSLPGQMGNRDRLMCLTCHKAHASQFDNMLRWDAKKPGFIANGQKDGYHQISNGDNPAYGCNKCHLMGGANAYVKAF